MPQLSTLGPWLDKARLTSKYVMQAVMHIPSKRKIKNKKHHACNSLPLSTSNLFKHSLYDEHNLEGTRDITLRDYSNHQIYTENVAISMCATTNRGFIYTSSAKMGNICLRTIYTGAEVSCGLSPPSPSDVFLISSSRVQFW